MVQLQFLSGEKAGNGMVVRHFPFVLGRSPNSDLRLKEAGVWDRHLAFEISDDERIRFVALGEGMVERNGEMCQAGVLQNGDQIRLGSLKLQCSLAPAKQKDFRWYAYGMLAGVAMTIIAQIVLMIYLLQ